MYSTIVFGVGSVPLNIPQPIVTYKLKSSRFYIARTEYFYRGIPEVNQQKWNFM